MKTEKNTKKKIFIVDDDTFLLSIYSTKFEKNGYEVNIAKSGDEALDKLRGGYRPDILILDLVMPVMNGFSAYEIMKKENLIPECLSIMLTNQSTPADISKAKELGFSGFIVKATVTPSEVIEEVEKICKKDNE